MTPPRGRTAAHVQTGGRRMTLETAAANANYGDDRVRQLVLRGDAHPAARAARGDVPDLQLLPAGRRHRRFRWPARPSGWPRFSNGATISTRCIRAIRRRGCGTTSPRCEAFGLKREDFLAIVDGMEMDVPQDIRAPDLATLDLYCDRVASAVGRLSVRVFGLPEDDGILLAHHLGRALQLTNILRDIDEDAGARPAVSAARRRCCTPASPATIRTR